MRFWLLHSSDVPIQDQIVAQVFLGIQSGELSPGERLPSVRELARRFHIHPNTVSLAYRRLVRDGRVETRRGSGIFVRDAPSPTNPAAPAEYLDTLIAHLIETARSLGVPPATLAGRVRQAVEAPHTSSFILVEPNASLRQILQWELAPVVRIPLLLWASVAEHEIPDGATVLVVPSKFAGVRSALRSTIPVHALSIRSVPHSLAEWLPAPVTALVGVASHWPPFLDFARTLLVAAGFSADALMLRDANIADWCKGLAQSDAVVCDAYTASLLPRTCRAIPFPLLADETLTEVRALESTPA